MASGPKTSDLHPPGGGRVAGYAHTRIVAANFRGADRACASVPGCSAGHHQPFTAVIACSRPCAVPKGFGDGDRHQRLLRGPTGLADGRPPRLRRPRARRDAENPCFEPVRRASCTYPQRKSSKAYDIRGIVDTTTSPSRRRPEAIGQHWAAKPATAASAPSASAATDASPDRLARLARPEPGRRR